MPIDNSMMFGVDAHWQGINKSTILIWKKEALDCAEKIKFHGPPWSQRSVETLRSGLSVAPGHDRIEVVASKQLWSRHFLLSCQVNALHSALVGCTGLLCCGSPMFIPNNDM